MGGKARGLARTARLTCRSSNLKKSTQPSLKAWWSASAKSQPLAKRAAAIRTAMDSPTVNFGSAHGAQDNCRPPIWPLVWGLSSDTPKDPDPCEGALSNMWMPTNVPHL